MPDHSVSAGDLDAHGLDVVKEEEADGSGHLQTGCEGEVSTGPKQAGDRREDKEEDDSRGGKKK